MQRYKKFCKKVIALQPFIKHFASFISNKKQRTPRLPTVGALDYEV